MPACEKSVHDEVNLISASGKIELFKVISEKRDGVCRRQ